MTKEQAIEFLKEYTETNFSERCRDAHNMAIESLKQPTISLDKVEQAREEMATYIEPSTGQWTDGFNNGASVCIEILDNLIAESEDK